LGRLPVAQAGNMDKVKLEDFAKEFAGVFLTKNNYIVPWQFHYPTDSYLVVGCRQAHSSTEFGCTHKPFLADTPSVDILPN
jgi:hypothetical protein